jgi:uncharacterized protein involved in exopolysaccharide biosynthesis
MERAQVAERLAAMHEELAAGRRLLAQLRAREAEVVDRLLRLDGAVRILTEELVERDRHPAEGRP